MVAPPTCSTPSATAPVSDAVWVLTEAAKVGGASARRPGTHWGRHHRTLT